LKKYSNLIKQNKIMMKTISVFTLVITGLLFTACNTAPTTDEAINFNDEVIADQTKYLEYETVFIDALSYSYDDYTAEDTIPYEAVEKAVNELEESYAFLNAFVEENIEKYNKMEAFDTEDVFRLAFVKYLESYKELIASEYTGLMEIQKYYLEELEVTDDMIMKWDPLIEKAEQKGEEIEDAFGEKQKDFAAQYEFELVEQE
jgi:hypothetical protein